MGNAASSSDEEPDEAPPQQQSVKEVVEPSPPVPVKNSVESQPVQAPTIPVVSTEVSEADSESTVLYKKEPRLTGWICLLATSIIALTAVLVDLTDEWTSASWVLLVSVVSVVVSFFALIGYAFLRHRFVGRACGEGVSSYLILLFWIGGLAVAMNPSRQLAVTDTEIGLNVVRNANLYFSSWASFACIFYVCGSWTMTYWTRAADIIKSVTARLVKWWCLLVLSIIVLVASAQFHSSQNCPVGGKTDISVKACNSNNYAVALGALASLVSVVVIILAQVGFMHIYAEVSCAAVLFIMYTAGVGVITYNQGSGITIGNLYFATWGGCLVTILLLVDFLHELLKQRAERRGSTLSQKKWRLGSKPKEESDDKKPKTVGNANAVPPSQPAYQSQLYQSVEQQPRQQPIYPSTPSRRSSFDVDEFADARDDLDLRL